MPQPDATPLNNLVIVLHTVHLGGGGEGKS